MKPFFARIILLIVAGSWLLTRLTTWSWISPIILDLNIHSIILASSVKNDPLIWMSQWSLSIKSEECTADMAFKRRPSLPTWVVIPMPIVSATFCRVTSMWPDAPKMLSWTWKYPEWNSPLIPVIVRVRAFSASRTSRTIWPGVTSPSAKLFRSISP